MNESNLQLTNDELSDNEAAPCQDSSMAEPPPEFGLIDVIEAFTTMRHEWRQQTRENRELAATLESTARNILRLEETLTANLIVASDVQLESTQQTPENNAIPDRSSNDLVDAIVEIDLYLSRAVQAAAKAQALNKETSTLALAIGSTYDNMNFVSRWICKNFHNAIHELIKVDQHSDSSQVLGDSIIDGLVLLESRLRRIMDRHQIERRETIGQPFDAAMMRAIGSMPSQPDRPVMAGQVVEQVAPTYLWNGKVIRFAEVRVAR